MNCVVESLGVSGPDVTTGVTSFEQEACSCTEVMGAHYFSGSSITSGSDIQDLKEYFRRPVAIASGAFTTGVKNLVYSQNINASTLFSTLFSTGLTRLTGVMGLRFKMVYTLQVAASPFHQGVVALAWQYACNGTSDTNTYVRCRYSHTSTNLPHTRLDLSSQTMAQLEVPFVYLTEYLSINSGVNFGPLGLVSLNTILPIASVAGISPPTYHLYLHLEDLELVGAAPYQTASITLQSGKAIKPMNKEFEDDAYPYSSSLHAFSRGVKFLAKGVPLLSSIAGPTAWFLEKSAGAVRSFGFSKPQIQEPIGRMMPMISCEESNVDGPSPTSVVGAFRSSQLRVGPEFSKTEVDEMSLSYVLSQWTQICTGVIGTGTAIGQVLYYCALSPSCLWYRAPGIAPYSNFGYPIISGASANSFSPSNIFYFGSMFRFWRGSLKFRITFGKTKMHGGRIMLAFNPDYGTITIPGVSGSTTAIVAKTATLTDPSGYSKIFDLKDDNVVEFEVPYTNPTPWTQFDMSVGNFTMSMIDALQAPSVVSNTIEFMVEVCAGSDFELCVPRTPLFPAHITGTPRLQSSKRVVKWSENLSEFTTGESVNSLKQVIMIPKANVTGTLAAGASGSFVVPPWYYQPTYSALTPGPTTMLPNSFGFAGNVAACYAFARGSTDCHVYPTGGSDFRIFASTCANDENNQVSTAQSPLNPSATNNPRVFGSGNSPLHVRFPGSASVYRVPISLWTNPIGATAGTALVTDWSPGASSTNSVTVASSVTPIVFRVSAVNSTAAAQTAVVSRCAGDDAMASMFMGPPPLVLPSVNTAATKFDPDAKLSIFD